ncbi:MAG: hypothetical protein H7Z16_01635 [Pyrinomonadaceae bacterium]|nr:hypothetical protein [Pyrinomonadaceae bacterium]
MLIDSNSEEVFTESKRSPAIKILGAVLALAVTALVFIGYTYLRNKHAQDVAAITASQTVAAEPKGPPQALITVDDALLQGGKTILGGTVKNTSTEKLGPLTIELELRRRKDGGVDKKSVTLEPSEIEPQQEARYSVELRAQEYGSARVVALRAEGVSLPLPYSTAQGRKRPLERPESKTITVGKRPGAKEGEFLNSADNPARIP